MPCGCPVSARNIGCREENIASHFGSIYLNISLDSPILSPDLTFPSIRFALLLRIAMICPACAQVALAGLS